MRWSAGLTMQVQQHLSVDFDTHSVDMVRENVCHQEHEFWHCWQRLSSERYLMLDPVALLVFLIKITTILKPLTYNLDAILF